MSPTHHHGAARAASFFTSTRWTNDRVVSAMPTASNDQRTTATTTARTGLFTPEIIARRAIR
jgi:hypothetical protein